MTMRFSHKLLLTYLLIVIVPVAAIGFFAYTISAQAVREKISESIRGTLEQIRDNIKYKTDDIQRISSRIYHDYNLQKYLRHYEEGWYTYETTKEYIVPTLDSVLNYTENNILVTLYLENSTFPEMYQHQDGNRDFLLTSKNYDVYHQSRITDETWFQQLAFDREINEGIIWRQVELDRRFGNISLLRQLDDFQQWKSIGLIRVTIKLRDLLASVNHENIVPDGRLYVYDERGEQLYYSGAAAEDEGGGEKELLLTHAIPELGWQIAAYIPERTFSEHADKVRNLTILVCLASLLVLSGISALVSRYFARRVGKILATLRAFQDGEFDKRIRFRGRDEFSQIAEALSLMGQNTNNLIQQVYVTNLLKNEAELTSLQAQINPHFLYNTLSSISRLAKFGEIDKLHTMVMGLAKFYRLSLSDGKTIIPIEKEIEQARTYVDIQKVKYGSRVEVDWEIDPAVLAYDTLKLVLQPFIENVLEHAWRGDQVRIVVSAGLAGEQVEFLVTDNGVGMTEETVREIFAGQGARRGYGIRNVDERIKLHYGKAYGVAITSRPGAGTQVRIVIPARKEAADEAAAEGLNGK